LLTDGRGTAAEREIIALRAERARLSSRLEVALAAQRTAEAGRNVALCLAAWGGLRARRDGGEA
jgi:hypothetical protein